MIQIGENEHFDAAKHQTASRSHRDLREHIQAQLKLFTNQKIEAPPLGQQGQPGLAPTPGAPPQSNVNNAGDDRSGVFAAQGPAALDDQEAGATVIEMHPPAPAPAGASELSRADSSFTLSGPPPLRTSEADKPAPQLLKPVAEPPTAAGQDSVLERVNGNLSQLASVQGGILRRIIEEKLTGQLLLISEGEHENQQELAYIQDGVLLSCSSLLQTPIRSLLLSAGLIRVEDIDEARKQTATSGEGHAVETWLIRQGLVTREQVFETLGVAAREAVVSIMCREYGMFVWKRMQQLNAPKVLCKAPMREVALHYGRSLDNFEAIQPDLFNPQRIFKIHDSFNLMHSQYRLLPYEWKFLFRVDGKKTIRQIREAIDIPADSLNRHIFVCDLMGFISDCGLAPGEAMAEVAIAAPPPSGRPAAPAHQAPRPQAGDDRPKILIVDDSRTVQKMVLMALEKMNYNIRTADDGIEALQLVETTPPDLVLLDVIMPRIDGYKVCSKIRKCLAPVKIPIIMLTAKDGTYNNIRAKLAGATAVMNKPFDSEELRQIISKHLAVR